MGRSAARRESGNVTEIDVGCTPELKKEDGKGETNTTEETEIWKN